MRNGRSSRLSRREGRCGTSLILLARWPNGQIVDDWQVLGIAGNGSKSLILPDVFPSRRAPLRDGQRPVCTGRAWARLVTPIDHECAEAAGFLVYYSLTPVAHGDGRATRYRCCDGFGLGSVRVEVTKWPSLEVREGGHRTSTPRRSTSRPCADTGGNPHARGQSAASSPTRRHARAGATLLRTTPSELGLIACAS